MRRHRVEGAGVAVAERAAEPRHFVGLAVHRAAHHQKNALRAEARGFRGNDLRCGTAVNDALNRGENKHPGA
jgi:hypothetical protein